MSEFKKEFEDDLLESENIEEYDIQIVCPYCEEEFIVDLDQNSLEIECPNCSNVIELDWSGNPEEDLHNTFGCGSGHCSKCKGCSNQKQNKDEDDDF